MFAIPFARILWKEYRVHRTLWLCCVVLGFVVQLFTWYSSTNYANRQAALFYLPMLFAVMYALGCGAMLFAIEREERTSDWLLSLSIPPGPTLAGKFVLAVASTIVLHVVLALISLLLNGGIHHFDDLEQWSLWSPSGLFVLIWSALGSLSSRRVMTSIGAMVFWVIITVVIPILLFQWISMSLWNSLPYKIEGQRNALAFVLFFGALGLEAWIGWRWCQGKYLDGAILENFDSRCRLWWNELTSRPSSTLRIPTRAEYGQPWRRTWQRLVWQERKRESSHKLLLFFGCSIGLMLGLGNGIWNFDANGGLPGFFAFILLGAIPLAMGVLGFESDSKLQQLRFLGNRGISPAAVWLAKQAVWMSRAFWITAVVYIVSLFFEWRFVPARWGTVNGQQVPLPRTFERLTSLFYESDLMIWYVLLSYGSGQLVSMLCRRVVLAGVFGILLTCLFVGWSRLMLFLCVPSWWSLGFPFSAMLFITLWQMRARMLEVQSLMHRVKLFFVLMMAPALLVTAVVWYRYAEVAALPVLDTVDKNQSLAWQSALNQFQPIQSLSVSEAFVRNRIDIVSRSQAARDQETVDQIVDLMRRDLHKLNIEPATQSANDVWTLTRVLLSQADEFALNEQLGRALECYLASLKLARLSAKHGEIKRMWTTATFSQYMILEKVVTWASHPSQTPISIAEAMKLIEGELSKFPPATEGIAAAYLHDKRLIIDHLSIEQFNEFLLNQPLVDRTIFEVEPILFFPGEQMRLGILMARETEFLFSEILSLETKLAAKAQFTHVATTRTSSLQSKPTPQPLQNPLLEKANVSLKRLRELVLQRQTEIRGAMTRMEIIAYRLKHGRLPDRLVELMETIDGTYLIDPWSDRFFDYYPTFLLSIGSTNTVLAPVAPDTVGIKNDPTGAGMWKMNIRQVASQSNPIMVYPRFGGATPSSGPIQWDTAIFPIPPGSKPNVDEPKIEKTVEAIEDPKQNPVEPDDSITD